MTDYSLMDLLDDFILGPLNWVDRLEWLVRGALYGDFGAKFAIPRADKSESDAPTLNEVERLLKRYGARHAPGWMPEAWADRKRRK